MPTQQVTLGRSGAPLDGSTSAINGSLFLNEPAPMTQVVMATGTAGASGGTGSYTYLWSVTSGGATINGSATNPGVNVQQTCTKNMPPNTGVVQCQISDGVGTISRNHPYSLGYTTDI